MTELEKLSRRITEDKIKELTWTGSIEHFRAL